MSLSNNLVFRIPDRLEELEDEENFSNFYTVKCCYNVSELPLQIDEAIDLFKSTGTEFIFETFDTFYSIVKHFKSLDSKVKEMAWKLLLKAANKLHTELGTFFEDFQVDRQIYYQNKLQMIIYTFLEISERFEDGDHETEMSRKKKVKTIDVYHSNKQNFMNDILKIFTLRLDRLFKPAHFLNSFVNIVTKMAYKIIETCSRNKNPNLFQIVCEIIGVAIEKYDHISNYCMKIIELLQSKESLSTIVAHLVIFNIKHGNQHWLISSILEQIKLIDVNELCRDSSAPRAISAFLICIAENCTEQMFKCMSGLLDFLEQDSYLLRNAALEIISIIIIKLLKMPKIKRDELIKRKLLKNLEDHIHDNTSYTRSKVLHLWDNLLQNRAIPISSLNNVIRLILDRLEDKSCYVRKNAVHFLTSTMKDNPFNLLKKNGLLKLLTMSEKKYNTICKVYEELINNQGDQIKKMVSIENDLINGNNNDTNEETDNDDVNDESNNSKRKNDSTKSTYVSKRQKFDLEEITKLGNQWSKIEHSFYDYWKTKGHKLVLSEEITDEMPQNDFKTGIKYFNQLLIEKKFEKALNVLHWLQNLYPTEKVFQLKKSNDNGDIEEDGDDNIREEIDVDNVDYLDSIFLSCVTNSLKSIKLPYEIKLSRLIFLAPLIEWGKAENENNGYENESLQSILEKKNEEYLHGEKTVQEYQKKLNQLSDIICRLNCGLEYWNLITGSISKICELLNSRNITDVQEAINFFTYAHRMELPNSIVGVQKMLKLIFTKEKTIKDALLEAFIDIYLNDSNVVPENDDEEEDGGTGNNTKKSLASQEIRNMSHMLLRLNQGELICAEFLIQQLYASKKFDQIHLRVLWERFAMKLSNTSLEESRAALMIIGMIASAEPSLIRNETNLNNIINISLVERKQDYRLVADSCNVLLKAFTIPSTESMEHFFKLQPNHILFEHLKTVLIDSITGPENSYWFKMSSSIIKVIYFLSEKPDYIISDIIFQCYTNITNLAKPKGDSTSPNSNAKYVSDIHISYFIFLLGEISLCILNYFDLHLMKEFKIRQFIKEKEQMSKKNFSKKKQSLSNRNRSMSLNSEMDDMIEPNNGDDPYQEQISKICSEQILFENGMLSKFTNLVESIASDYHGDKYTLQMRRSACLTLAKFMTLSLKYTRKNRLILADILEKSKDCIIRSNAVVSFGDLLLRFPNEIEHNTGKIFSCLEDNDFVVKSNSLKVLSRLVLSDMIKPKGNISKIAALVIDKEKYISSSARLFFVELSKKNNTYIYNFLPDIISNLSGQKGLPEERFQEMIKFLFELLEKTRNTESLVSKLCTRFHNTNDERTWRDLSFCLSQLQYNDRAFYNLMSSFNLFSDTLYCDAIHENFMSIINTMRKGSNLKQETKNLIDELESKMSEVRSKGSIGNPVESEAQQVPDDANAQENEDVNANCFAVPSKPVSVRKKQTRMSAKKSSVRKEKHETLTNDTKQSVRRSTRARKKLMLADISDENNFIEPVDDYEFDED